jgi:hypothetical protein
MYTTNPNPLIQNSFLSSKFLDPNYLFILLQKIFFAIFNTTTLNTLYVILSFLAIFFIAVIIYSSIRMFEVRAKEHAHLHHEIEEYRHNQAMREEKNRGQGIFKNEKWRRVLDYLFSNNPNDWKLAVIEADLILLDLLTQLGFKGDSLGDKLKNADPKTFRYISSAWEAHNVRNKIAHEGSIFELSLHEAKRVIAIYEQIFVEFGYI